MSNSPHGSNDRSVRRRLEAAATNANAAAPETDGDDDGDRSPALECIVVRYRDRPDRCTIAPRECPEETRVTHWLSANLSAVVDLEEAR